MRETDESRAILRAAKQYMTNAAAMTAQVMDAAETGEWGLNRKPDPADVRGMIDGFRGILDSVEAQLLARIPSVRP